MNEANEARRRAIDANKATWSLLEKADRTPEETARMIGTAHASLAAWEKTGGPTEAQRGNWLIARVYLDAGHADAAMEFARRTMELTKAHKAILADFDLAFAKEIAARAWAANGNLARAREHYDGARMLGEAIADPGDKAEFFRQFALPPWFGLEAEP